MSTRPVQWPGDDESKPAPGRLTACSSAGQYGRTAGRFGPARRPVADARPWLVDNQLLARHAELAEADLDLVRGVREVAARAAGAERRRPDADRHRIGPASRDRLRLARRRACLARRRRGAADGDTATRCATGWSTCLLIVRDAQLDGTWALLKACANDECQWAFYDKSRNHGGTWCEMSTCGNKLKNRAFRARSKAR